MGEGGGLQILEICKISQFTGDWSCLYVIGIKEAENCPLFSLKSEKKVFCYGLNVCVLSPSTKFL